MMMPGRNLLIVTLASDAASSNVPTGGVPATRPAAAPLLVPARPRWPSLRAPPPLFSACIPARPSLSVPAPALAVVAPPRLHLFTVAQSVRTFESALLCWLQVRRPLYISLPLDILIPSPASSRLPPPRARNSHIPVHISLWHVRSPSVIASHLNSAACAHTLEIEGLPTELLP
ncbi:hypothetical protein DFH09DRAFT_1330064 [Mycena vulgaris]|nr:hypothetical protein DFH09DRAFT_1330064 [Mycena vulgaris]